MEFDNQHTDYTVGVKSRLLPFKILMKDWILAMLKYKINAVFGIDYGQH
jgi:hypothetical protein